MASGRKQSRHFNRNYVDLKQAAAKDFGGILCLVTASFEFYKEIPARAAGGRKVAPIALPTPEFQD